MVSGLMLHLHLACEPPAELLAAQLEAGVDGDDSDDSDVTVMSFVAIILKR